MTETTTVRVSKSTLRMLERIRQKTGVSSLDEAIKLLIAQQRALSLEKIFGVDRKRIKPFTEEDRGEDRP